MMIPSRLTKLNKNKDNKPPFKINCWLGCGATGILTHCWWKCKLVQPLWKTASLS